MQLTKLVQIQYEVLPLIGNWLLDVQSAPSGSTADLQIVLVCRYIADTRRVLQASIQRALHMQDHRFGAACVMKMHLLILMIRSERCASLPDRLWICVVNNCVALAIERRVLNSDSFHKPVNILESRGQNCKLASFVFLKNI